MPLTPREERKWMQSSQGMVTNRKAIRANEAPTWLRLSIFSSSKWRSFIAGRGCWRCRVGHATIRRPATTDWCQTAHFHAGFTLELREGRTDEGGRVCLVRARAHTSQICCPLHWRLTVSAASRSLTENDSGSAPPAASVRCRNLDQHRPRDFRVLRFENLNSDPVKSQ